MEANGYTVQCIRQNLGLESEDKSRDEMIATMTKHEQLERALRWNNLIGYGQTVKRIVEDIYGMELKDTP